MLNGDLILWNSVKKIKLEQLSDEKQMYWNKTKKCAVKMMYYVAKTLAVTWPHLTDIQLASEPDNGEALWICEAWNLCKSALVKQGCMCKW